MNILERVADFRKQIVEETERGVEYKISTCPNAEGYGWSTAQHNAMGVLKRELERDYGENVLAIVNINHGVYDWSITILGGPTCEVK